jgi:hypothetical protein
MSKDRPAPAAVAARFYVLELLPFAGEARKGEKIR